VKGLRGPAGRPLRLLAPHRLAPLAGLAALFGLWEAYVRLADVRPLIAPPPSRVLAHLVTNAGFYADNAATTVFEAGSGFVIALVAALAVASAMVHWSLVERASWPVIVLLQSTPVVVLAPVFIVWFGFGPWPKIVVAMLFTFVPFVSNAFTGLRSIDPDAERLLRSVDASRLQVFVLLRWPSALPALFAAARYCVSLALVGAVVGELYTGSSRGLGYQTRTAQARSLVDQLWASIFTLALIGVVATLGTIAVERRVLRWHPSGSDL
jgi:NitT/TauT family transport system permease protein